MGSNIVSIEHYNLTSGGQGAGQHVTGVLSLVTRHSGGNVYSYFLRLSDCTSASHKTVEVSLNKQALKELAQALLDKCEQDEQGGSYVR